MPRLPEDGAHVEMGRFGKALALKGEIFLIWHGEEPPSAGARLLIEDGQGGFKELKALSVRVHKDRLVARLEGIGDRTAAEGLVGRKIFQAKGDLRPPGEGEAFLMDLLGCGVYLPDGAFVGTLEHVDFPANQPVWAIASPAGKEILFPAQERFIESILPEERKVVISPPEGLLEIYNA